MVVLAEVPWELEQVIDRQRFFDIELGATLNDFLITLGHSPKLNTLLEAGKTAYGCVPHWPSKSPNITESDQRRILFTWIADTPRLSDLVLPVIDALGGDSCAVLGRSKHMRARLPSGCAFYLESETGLASWWRWVRELGRVAPPWLRVLERERTLPLEIRAFLFRTLVQQSRRFVSFWVALEQMRPRAVVTEFDRGAFASPLLLAARALGIPTATMVHGAVSLMGLTPLVADIALCWGEEHVEVFRQAGTAPERLVITGCQRSGLLAPDKTDVRRRLRMPQHSNAVLLATTNGPPREERIRFAKVFCDAVPRMDDVIPVVRVHPCEKAQDYAEISAAYPFVRVIDNAEVRTEEAIAVSSIVISGDSSFPLDASMQGCPVVILDIEGGRLRGSRLAMGGDGPVATDGTELEDILTRYFSDQEFHTTLNALAKQHGKRVSVAVGAEAAQNVAAELERRALK